MLFLDNPLGPARPVTDSLKSQSSTRDHPYEHVIFPNKLMKQRCPDMSHQGERQGQADHAVQCKHLIGERLVGWPDGRQLEHPKHHDARAVS